MLGVLSLLAAMIGTSDAQVDQPVPVARTTWTTDTGLPQNSVVGIGEDPDGYIWIATFGGLARFDGHRFETFDVGSRTDLETSTFHRLYAARDGSIWVGTQDHGVIRYKDDAFVTFDLPTPIHTITEDRDGTIWASAHGGAFRFMGDRFERLIPDAAYALCATRDGAIWSSTWSGIERLDGGELQAVGPDQGLPHEIFWAIHEAADGLLWLATGEALYVSTDATKTSFVAIEGAPAGTRRIATDDAGNVWLTGYKGLIRWDIVDGIGQRLTEHHDDCLFVDSRQNVWTGSRGKGLVSFHQTPLQDATAALGLPSGDVWLAGVDKAGRVFIGARGVLVVVDGERIEQHSLGDNVTAVATAREGGLWVGRPGAVLNLADEISTRFKVPVISGGRPRALLESASGALWIGTTRGLFTAEGNRAQRVPFAFRDAYCIVEGDVEGDGEAVWAGGSDGLIKIVDGEIRRRITAADGAAPGIVRTIHIDDQGVLWAGTYGGGMTRVEGRDVRRFSRRNGLANDYVSSIVEDGDGRFWLNTNIGPVVVRREDLNRVARGEADRVTCITFSSEEGACEANGGFQPGGGRSADGRIWFPTIEGVTVIDPSRLPASEAPPRVVIESLVLDESRRLDATVAALGFTSPGRVEVQYRMLGERAAWTGMGAVRTVQFAYVPPGEHRFQVRARNGSGPWSDIVERTASVRPKLHERAIFQVAVVLLACLATLGVGRFQLRRVREHGDRLTTLIAEREEALRSLDRSRATLSRLSQALLTAQDAERRRIASELHDDVTQRLAALAIQAELVEARLDIDPKQSRSQLNDIVSMAQQLAGDVQDLSRRLHPMGLQTLGLTQAIQRECDALTRRGGAAVEVCAALSVDELSNETAMTVFRVLQESLRNIEKHARASTIEVLLETRGGEVILTVMDTGRGFDLADGGPTGLGLVTMQERATAVGGRLTVTSEVGVGTTVELHAPLVG